MNGDRRLDTSQSKSQDEEQPNEIDSDTLTTPQVNAKMLLRVGLGTLFMLLFIVYNFGWYIYSFTFPKIRIGKIIQDGSDG